MTSSVGVEPNTAHWAFTHESTDSPVERKELHGGSGRFQAWTGVASPQHPQPFPPTRERLRAGKPARRVDPPAGWRSVLEDRSPPLNSYLAGTRRVETPAHPGTHAAMRPLWNGPASLGLVSAP